jgi:hypothetical protein
MELLNATGMKAGYTMGLRPDGRELLVIVVKGTFTIPSDPRHEPELAAVQAPLVMADEFTGAPGFSAPLHESDFAPRKPRCDVVPKGEPARRVRVGLRVGSWEKSFDVAGNSVWRKRLFLVSRSRPQPFTVMPISYDNAFGGFDQSHPNPKRHRAFLANPVGRGFHSNLRRKAIAGKPAPNTQEIGRPVRKPRRTYRPMAFGPIGRSWSERIRHAGTYDQNWIDNIFPFLPPDFDERYYQCAPPDQQIDYLTGGEEVSLLNLTPQGRASFKLPRLEVPVTFHLKRRDKEEFKAPCDTLIIEPDLNRFMMLWRAALPLRRNMFEVAMAVVGRMPRAWHRARELGKTWYPSLQHLVSARKAERADNGDPHAPQTPET